MSKGGYRLSNHMDRLNATAEEKAFEDIDMVVLQEYGGYYPSYITTSELISKIGKDKKYYTFTSMLEGVYDWSFQQEILTTLNVTLVVTPVLQYDSSLKKSDFMMSDNIHPTSLYGYVNALALYCKIFNVKATEQNNGCLTAYDIPGSTAEEDAAYMVRLKKAVQRMLDDQREA